MADRRDYALTIRTGKDGTQYLRIRETSSVRRQIARQWASILAEDLNLLKTGFQRAFRFVSRRA